MDFVKENNRKIDPEGGWGDKPTGFMMNRIMATLGAKVYKKYRIYEKSI